MCTAVTFQTKDHYFGRNLDFDVSYQETVAVTPRNFPFRFRCMPAISKHLAIIGMSTVDNGYPLYYDGTNEHGLSMAGLYFPGNAVYRSTEDEKVNIAPFEFIPWILSQCSNVEQAMQKLERLNLVDIPYSKSYPQSPLHWMIADKKRAITVEPFADGLRIQNNPVGVLTNNPPFEYHIFNLSNYMNLTRNDATNRFAPEISIEPYSRGMGAVGLPGDLSSASRFVKAAFTRHNSVCDDSEDASISQFFHILKSVEQQNGCVKIGEHFEKTIYSSCCNTDKGIYYYTTYDNAAITGVNMQHVDLDSDSITTYPLITKQQVTMQN